MSIEQAHQEICRRCRGQVSSVEKEENEDTVSKTTRCPQFCADHVVGRSEDIPAG